MSILQRFKKAVGIAETDDFISDRENLRRGTVRNGNLDWRGLPIDRHAGGPGSASPALRGFNKLVAEFKDAIGADVEQRGDPNIPTLSPSQFDRDVDATEQAAKRRHRYNPLDGPAWLR